MSDGGFYSRLSKEREDSADLISVVMDTADGLTAQVTDENRPGMLLGKIQSGKTRAFLGIIAEYVLAVGDLDGNWQEEFYEGASSAEFLQPRRVRRANGTATK